MVLGLLAIFFLLFNKRHAHAGGLFSLDDPKSLEIIEEICKLDNLFASGDISEAKYIQERTELKSLILGFKQTDVYEVI